MTGFCILIKRSQSTIVTFTLIYMPNITRVVAATRSRIICSREPFSTCLIIYSIIGSHSRHKGKQHIRMLRLLFVEHMKIPQLGNYALVTRLTNSSLNAAMTFGIWLYLELVITIFIIILLLFILISSSSSRVMALNYPHNFQLRIPASLIVCWASNAGYQAVIKINKVMRNITVGLNGSQFRCSNHKGKQTIPRSKCLSWKKSFM